MDKFIERDFPRLVSLIYDAALDPTAWPRFLDELPKAFDSAIGVFRFSREPGKPSEDLAFGGDPAFLQSYADYYHRLNPYDYTDMAAIAPGHVKFVSDLRPPGEAEATEFYNDWMVPQGLTADHIACSLFRNTKQSAIIALGPHVSVYRKNRQLYADRLELLAPHLARALAISHKLTGLLDVERVLSKSLDSLGAAAFALTPSGRVFHTNALGELLIGHNDVLVLKGDGLLSAKSAAEAVLLEAAIGNAMKAGSVVAPPIRLTSRAGGKAYLAWVMAMRPGADGGAANPLQLLDGLDRQGAILVLVTAVDRKMEVSDRLLRNAFGLSAAEARLVAALVAGESLGEFACRLNLSRNTLRNQMASIFDKTGTSRQAELVAHVLTAVGPFAGGSDAI